MLRCPETHEEAFLVMSTGEMVGRMVRSGILGCPVCRKEYPIVKGIVNFSARGPGAGHSPRPGYGVASGVPGQAPGGPGRAWGRGRPGPVGFRGVGACAGGAGGRAR